MLIVVVGLIVVVFLIRLGNYVSMRNKRFDEIMDKEYNKKNAGVFFDSSELTDEKLITDECECRYQERPTVSADLLTRVQTGESHIVKLEEEVNSIVD